MAQLAAGTKLPHQDGSTPTTHPRPCGLRRRTPCERSPDVIRFCCSIATWRPGSARRRLELSNSPSTVRSRCAIAATTSAAGVPPRIGVMISEISRSRLLLFRGGVLGLGAGRRSPIGEQEPGGRIDVEVAEGHEDRAVAVVRPCDVAPVGRNDDEPRASTAVGNVGAVHGVCRDDGERVGLAQQIPLRRLGPGAVGPQAPAIPGLEHPVPACGLSCTSGSSRTPRRS